MIRTIYLVEMFDIKGRGTAYVVKAPDPPYELGEIVYMDNVAFKITGVEKVMTNPAKPVVNGMQCIMLAMCGR